MGNRVFITGSTGNIGGKTACRILRNDPDSQVLLLVRARSESEAMDRVATTFSILSPDLEFSTIRDRIRVYCGDITLDRLGLDEQTFKDLSEDLTHIVHCAAVTKFNMELSEARAVNKQGTLNVMSLARMAKESGNLKRVAHVSTAYVCGNQEGTIFEDELISDPGFSNAYQQSKWETEQIVREMTEELPIIILRPSVVTGGSLTGRTLAFNVLYTPLKWIHRGSIKFMPGSADTPLDVVPLDFVANAISHILLMEENHLGRTFHIAAGKKCSTTIGEVLEKGTDYFERKSSSYNMKKIRFVPPLLADTVLKLLPSKRMQSQEKIKLFRSFMCIHREFDTTNTEKALTGSGISPPVFGSYFENIMDFCFTTKWGERLQC